VGASSSRWSRVKLSLAPKLKVEFTGRDRALEQVERIAREGVGEPLVVFGPEGCGKTAWLLQAKAILEWYDYTVIYVNPLERRLKAAITYTRGLSKAISRVLSGVGLTLAGAPVGLEVSSRAVANIPFFLVDTLQRLWRGGRLKLAILVDDVFQAIGLNEVSSYVKSSLNLIEYPPSGYESIVVIITTSEGLSREEIGRHRWADLRPLWNMNRGDFEKLYNSIPEPKPGFDEVWRLTGGNPGALSSLYRARWNVDLVVGSLVERRVYRLISSLKMEELEGLRRALDDPDVLSEESLSPLLHKLGKV